MREAARAGDAQLELRRYRTAAAGETALREGRADVLIVAGRQLVWKSEPDDELAAVVTPAVQRLRFGERAAALGLTDDQATRLLAPGPLPARTLEPADPDQDAREAIAFVTTSGRNHAFRTGQINGTVPSIQPTSRSGRRTPGGTTGGSRPARDQ
ncbi:MAG TPA: hypothetical protein VHJ39_04245 [Solirubrobacteraceae bacterium]|nr:hypothetical protein [Solirubrobacteraceae bacterium]